MKKKILKSVFYSFSSLLLGAIICFIMTPIWWKLEALIGVELAGHSGPSDWLVILFSSLCGLAGLLFSLKFNSQ